jgi:hypothetical protein
MIVGISWIYDYLISTGREMGLLLFLFSNSRLGRVEFQLGRLRELARNGLICHTVFAANGGRAGKIDKIPGSTGKTREFWIASANRRKYHE